MSSFYTSAQRELQHQFSTAPLADAEVATIVHAELADHEIGFIESRDMFFLSTVDSRGQPTCSYKGGDPGFIRAVDARTLVFPLFNGNGMFLSAGNIAEQSKVGLLFIDFDTPNRLRVHGTARLEPVSDAWPRFEGAELLAVVAVESVFINCARYVHKRPLVERSRYVPRADEPTPFAQWKRIDLIQPVLPPADQGQAALNGGTITMDEYVDKVARGVS